MRLTRFTLLPLVDIAVASTAAFITPPPIPHGTVIATALAASAKFGFDGLLW